MREELDKIFLEEKIDYRSLSDEQLIKEIREIVSHFFKMKKITDGWRVK